MHPDTKAYLSEIGRKGGKKGGRAKSLKKTLAARANARKPRKKKITQINPNA